METLFWSWWLCINFSLFLSVIFTCELSNRKRRSWVLYLSTVLEKKAESLVLEAISLHQETDRRKLHFVFVCIYIYIYVSQNLSWIFFFLPLSFSTNLSIVEWSVLVLWKFVWPQSQLLSHFSFLTVTDTKRISSSSLLKLF